MPITIVLPDTLDFVIGNESFSHKLEAFGTDRDMIARHVYRAAAHGLKQFVVDASANAEGESDKREARYAAYARREKWFNSSPGTRTASDDSIWMAEADEILRLLKVPHKVRTALKTVDSAKAAILAAAGPIRGEATIKAVDHAAAKKRAAAANPDAALQALIDAAMDEVDEAESEAAE
jgi:hypothetical protein